MLRISIARLRPLAAGSSHAPPAARSCPASPCRARPRRGCAPGQRHGFGAVAAFADDRDAGLVLEDAPESLAHERVIVDEDDADADPSAMMGQPSFRGGMRIIHRSRRRARQRHPDHDVQAAPRPRPASKRPPISAARSRMLVMPMPPGPSLPPRAAVSAGGPFPSSATLKLDAVRVARQAHVDLRCLGVPGDVGQRFLDDAIEVRRHVRRQAGELAVRLEARVDAVLAGELVGVPGDGLLAGRSRPGSPGAAGATSCARGRASAA